MLPEFVMAFFKKHIPWFGWIWLFNWLGLENPFGWLFVEIFHDGVTLWPMEESKNTSVDKFTDSGGSVCRAMKCEESISSTSLLSRSLSLSLSLSILSLSLLRLKPASQAVLGAPLLPTTPVDDCCFLFFASLPVKTVFIWVQVGPGSRTCTWS